MTQTEPPIRVAVDPTNPGQFLACCGLLELANGLWPEAEGWFTGRQFHVACNGTLEQLIAQLIMDPPESVKTLDSGLAVKPIIAPLRFTFDGGASYDFMIDAWTQTRMHKSRPSVLANPPWNFWSGNQKSHEIWTGLRLALAQQLPSLTGAEYERLFAHRVPLTGRFGFDPGAAWNSLDVGFSPNTQGMAVASSPATELLAAVGLQRFRPVLSADRTSFFYSTWGKPLLPAAAAAAATGLVLVEPALRLRGRIVDRGQYSALTYSKILKGNPDE